MKLVRRVERRQELARRRHFQNKISEKLDWKALTHLRVHTEYRNTDCRRKEKTPDTMCNFALKGRCPCPPGVAAGEGSLTLSRCDCLSVFGWVLYIIVRLLRGVYAHIRCMSYLMDIQQTDV